jgi:hypothetical protein
MGRVSICIKKLGKKTNQLPDVLAWPLHVSYTQMTENVNQMDEFIRDYILTHIGTQP